ncbi:MAG: hypothetical protein RR825_02230, partial [Ruthenibacterium sp.]
AAAQSSVFARGGSGRRSARLRLFSGTMAIVWLLSRCFFAGGQCRAGAEVPLCRSVPLFCATRVSLRTFASVWI